MLREKETKYEHHGIQDYTIEVKLQNADEKV